MNKLWPSADAAVADIKDGMSIMVGGFTGVGAPWSLLDALERQGALGLTAIQTACNHEVRRLLELGRIARMITSFPVYNNPSRRTAFEHRFLSGEIALELVPQGTLAERIRAGGAGIPAFYTATGVGTIVAEGKPHAVFDGREYVQERWLRADVALIHANRADRLGNLTYIGTGRNFNPMMATAARITIAEVDELVEPGMLDPERIDTPAPYVQRIVVVGSR
ncbi:MAG: CoA transferase subunit A [Dehalococcoidia bacterium]